MPAMPRPKGLGKKIAYAVIGVPANIKNSKNAVGKQINKALVFQETARVK